MSLQLFDRIRAFIKSANLYRHENLLQNQNDINRAIQNGQLINYSSAGLLDQTNLQINRMERYKDFDQMDEMGEISLALDLYADESTQIEPERKHALMVRADTKEVKEELEKLFYDILNIDNKLRAMVRYLCKYGDFAAEIIPNESRTEVASFRPFNIYSFLRVETKYGDLVGFYFTDEMMTEPVFLHPWQIMHLRLTSYENIYAPYGRAVLDGGRKDFRRLRLMEDAALVYRITRAPEKRIFTIPVGNIPTSQVGQYLSQIADQFKRQRFYDPATGEVNWRYAPLIQEDDFWMPQRPDGTGPKVETMKGAENLDQIADIEYFKKKMVAPLKIPFSRVGIGEDSGKNADKSLSSTHTDFAKAVHFVQQEVTAGMKKIALIHLALKGFDTKQMASFDVFMTSSSAIEELYRIETWNSRAGVMMTLKETGLFPDDWILSHFTDMTEEEIEEMKEKKKEQPAPAAPAPGAEPAGLGLPGLEAIDKDHGNLIAEYAKILDRRHQIIVESRKPRRADTWSYLLNTNELDGLPLASKKTQSNVIHDDAQKDASDPFVIIEGVTDEQKPVEAEELSYIVPPKNNDEMNAAKEATKQLLTEMRGHADTEKMSYPIMRIRDAMDK
jgi:hypothetical protein